ncbi:interferon-induced protein 44-like [Ruditapes philippinarum]|uniref:interferon-induced protein 44-like n=1 Tax=Ruditapes philippinarum TaxID=129788 RepID=UPI00295B0E2C|nr:interferon-induced protein 44-like [Ruditapes philippinarum]
MAGKLTLSQKKQLLTYIQEYKKDFRLLYSFSKDGANSSTFHQLCNDRGPTVTIVYDVAGTIYGGYTEKSWSSSGQYVKDDRAFLFRLQQNGKTDPSKFAVKVPDRAIYCNVGYGPVFGGGYDLCTFSGTVTETNGTYPTNASYKFGYSYDMAGISVEELTNNIVTFSELEVYSVTDSVLVPVWRDIGGWEHQDLDQLKHDIENWSPPQGVGLKSANILLLGPFGAGKSSFFNTIASCFRGHTTEQAMCGSAELSITTKYNMYRVRGSAITQPMKFKLCDTRGLEENQGIDAQELGYLIDGNVPNGYEFNPSVQISPETHGFVTTPTPSNKVHCVCFVVDGTSAADLSAKMVVKIKTLQAKVRRKGLSQVVIVTKIDKVCFHVKEDASTVFRSASVKELIDSVATIFGISRNHVLPVKNYEKEINTKDTISILALRAMQQILRATDDYMLNLLDSSDDKNNHSDD